MPAATPRIAYILPSFRCFDYTRRCLVSLFRTTPNATAFLVDDGSPDWTTKWLEDIQGNVVLYRFTDNRGLTRSWNKGLTLALPASFDLIVAGNNDVLFTTGWWRGLSESLDAGVVLSGPLTNAPGMQATQQVSRYTSYYATDDATYNDRIAEELYQRYGGEYAPCAINGFFMCAKPSTWLKYAYRDLQVFPHQIDTMPSGRKNPTPHMTGQESWLCSRIHAAGGIVGASLGSFIWHYRSVSRGEKYIRGNWFRPAPKA